MSSSRKAWEPFEGVRLPLHARALVLQEGGHRIALVSLDLLGVGGEAVGGFGWFKVAVCAAADQLVRSDYLVLACSHTHSSPESAALTDLYRTEPFKKWTGHLVKQIGSAIRDAKAAVRPCKLLVGTRAAPGISVNRRIETTEGIASVRRELPPEVVIGPEGPNDDNVRVAMFVDGSGEPVSILVNATAHPVLEMCIKQVSPDYPGEMSRELIRRYPGVVPLFLQGACGNINPPTMERSAANSRRYGRNLADTVDKSLGDLQEVKGAEQAIRWKSIELPGRAVAGEPSPDPVRASIGALRLGNAVFVFLPGEPFVEIALAIREASPWPFTAVVGYAEDYIGYIPTDRAFENGGYETRPGRWSRLAPGCEPIVRRASIELLGEFGKGD